MKVKITIQNQLAATKYKISLWPPLCPVLRKKECSPEDTGGFCFCSFSEQSPPPDALLQHSKGWWKKSTKNINHMASNFQILKSSIFIFIKKFRINMHRLRVSFSFSAFVCLSVVISFSKPCFSSRNFSFEIFPRTYCS